MKFSTRNIVRVLIAAVAITTVSAVGAQTAQASPYCGITWGSLTKSAQPTKVSTLTNVRAGQHACYDRLVLDIGPKAANGYTVRYVSNVYMDGSGKLVPLRGGAKLQIVAIAPDYNSAGQPTYRPVNRTELVNVVGYSTFRQVAWAGSFEGQTTIGLGVRARLPFRVLNLAGPGVGSRIVIDVAHRW